LAEAKLSNGAVLELPPRIHVQGDGGHFAMEALMKKIMRAAVGAFLAAGIGTTAIGPADAAVRVTFGFPGPIP
jgi:hypothetical protein